VAVACQKEMKKGVAGVCALKNPGVLSLPIVVILLVNNPPASWGASWNATPELRYGGRFHPASKLTGIQRRFS